MQPVVEVASDPLIGWATVALVVATVALAAVAGVTLCCTVKTARQDREDADRRIKEQREYDDQRAQRDRADAEARLVAERRAADQRLEGERVHMEKTRQRERQQDSATRLLVRIAGQLPLMNRVPNVIRAASMRRDEVDVECEQAVEGLRFGGFGDLPGLRDARATEQYRTLVHLVLTVAGGEHQEDEDDQTASRKRSKLVAGDLLRYATFVRLSLEHLIEQGESLDPGAGGEGVSFPMLYRRPGDESLWSPPNVPQGWNEAISRDPNDPQYQPAK